MRNKVNVAVFIDDEITVGGGYQQAMNSISMCQRVSPSLANIVYATTKPSTKSSLKEFLGVEASYLDVGFFRRVFLECRVLLSNRYSSKLFRKIFGLNFVEKWFVKSEIDLVYFVTPSRISLYLETVNFIFTVYDLCHRDHPEFPEVREFYEIEWREKLYSSVLKKSVLNIVDSKLGMENIIRRYGVDREKVEIIQFSPSSQIVDNSSSNLVDLESKYGIHKPFVFYPAQYWPHKNHSYILYALKLYKERYDKGLSVVFCGADKGNKQFLMELSKSLGLSLNTHFLGFVSDADVYTLYKRSEALVMPTYFGPTNLPPYEAFRLGVPVFYSDLPGLREQVGEGAYLVDLLNPESLSDGLHLVLTNQEVRGELIECGKKVLSLSRPNDALKSIETVIKKFSAKSMTWRK